MGGFSDGGSFLSSCLRLISRNITFFNFEALVGDGERVAEVISHSVSSPGQALIHRNPGKLQTNHSASYFMLMQSRKIYEPRSMPIAFSKRYLNEHLHGPKLI